MPHPSFSTSRNFGSVFNRVFNLIQSALSDLPGSFHGNAAKHQKFDTNRWKTPVLFSIASIKFIHSFIHLTLTLNKVSRPHCHVLSTKKHVVPCKFRVFKKNSRQKPITCRTLYHSSLQKTLYTWTVLSCKFALSETIYIKQIFWVFDESKTTYGPSDSPLGHKSEWKQRGS